MDEPESTSGKLQGFKVVSLLTLLSRITGLARDALMASLFGTGWILDAFALAFRIPNMFRRLFGEGAMTAAFLPEFVRTDNDSGRKAANSLFSGVGWRLWKTLLAFTIMGEFVIGLLYLTTNLSDRSTLLCELSLILIPYMVLICIAGLYAAALNGVHHFLFPSLAPVVLNLVWLIGGLLAGVLLASNLDEVRAIAAFIVSGGVIQLVMLIRKAATFGIVLKPPDAVASDRASVVFKAMAPVLLGLSITQINGLVDSLLAWILSSGTVHRMDSLAEFQLPEGTAGALYLGQRMFQFPLGVFAVALGTVLFPRFARHAQAANRNELNRDVIHGLQLILVVGIPASVGLWFMAAPITDLLFRYGQFDLKAAQMTSEMIAAYSLGVWVLSGLLIVNRVFYAASDQMTPMRQGLICVGLNLIFDIVLLPFLGATALPSAGILAAIFQFGLALEVLRKRFLIIGRKAFISLLWRVLFCTILMAIVCISTLSVVTEYESSLSVLAYRLLMVFTPITVAVIAYGTGLIVVGVSPLRLLKQPVLPE